MEIHPKIEEYLATIDLTNKDAGAAFNQEAKICYWFHMFSDHELAQSGRDLTGYVFRQSGERCLLVVKVKMADIRQVVFCTARTPVGCMRVFCRKLYADTLAWKPDKYA